MHVTVVEAGTDKLPCQIHLLVTLVPQGQCLLIGTGEDKLICLHRKGLHQRELTGIDAAVVIDGFHDIPP